MSDPTSSEGRPRAVILMAAKPVVFVVVATASIHRRNTSMFFSQAASP